jgi:hypothetical protein
VEGLTDKVSVVPIAVHELFDVVPQLGPSKTSMKVLAAVRLFPPADMAAISISTEVQPAGVVNVYHTSYIVPAQEPAIPELVALNNVPDVFEQLVPGVRVVGVEQSSDCANKSFETIVKMNTNVVIRAVACNMVLKGFWNSKKYWKPKIYINTYSGLSIFSQFLLVKSRVNFEY